MAADATEPGPLRSLVTGGAGFIGSHLVDALAAAGDEVLVLDDLTTGRRENLRSASGREVRLVEGDIRDAELLRREIEGFRPERVFHLAAQADVRRAVADPAFDADVNVLGTVRLLDAIHRAGGAPVIFASTGGAIYGEGEGRALPFVESEPAAPVTAYGASKFAGETYVALYRRLHAMPGVALRFGNVYGPRQNPYGEAGVVAIFCGKMLAGEAPTIFGDGLQTRDYVYVADAVEAMLSASAALIDRGTALEGPVNIGTGEEGNVLDLLDLLSALVDAAPEPIFAPTRAGEVQRVSIDPRAAETAFGWRASTPLAQGLSAAFESVRERSSGG